MQAYDSINGKWLSSFSFEQQNIFFLLWNKKVWTTKYLSEFWTKMFEQQNICFEFWTEKFKQENIYILCIQNVFVLSFIQKKFKQKNICFKIWTKKFEQQNICLSFEQQNILEFILGKLLTLNDITV